MGEDVGRAHKSGGHMIQHERRQVQKVSTEFDDKSCMICSLSLRQRNHYDCPQITIIFYLTFPEANLSASICKQTEVHFVID